MDTYKYDPNYHRLADYVGLDETDRKDYNVAKKLLDIYKWASEKTKSQDFEVVAKQVTKLQKSLGVNFRGKTLIHDLYKTIRFDIDRQQLQQQQQQQMQARLQAQKELDEVRRKSKEIIKENKRFDRSVDSKAKESQEKIKETITQYKSNIYVEPTTKVKTIDSSGAKQQAVE